MQWKKGTPEAAGIPSSALLQWVEALDSYEHVHSFMLIRNGMEAASGWWRPYDPETPHLLYSLSKSFISCAVGFAVSENKLTLDTPLLKIFPDYRKFVTDKRFEEMTIRHLLTMATGHECCSTGYFKLVPDGDLVYDFFTSPLACAPGERFVYNSGGTFMLAAALRRVTGENPREYLRSRMLDALEIGDRLWDKSPDGTDFGGWGYRLTTREIASFAYMLLNGGKVNNRQILPADYLKEAVSKQIDNSMNDKPDWQVGYGFQFWRCRHNAFRGDGAFGQYALVLPDENMAVAITAGGKNMQLILDTVWDILLPSLSSRPLEDAPAERKQLEQKLASLSLPVLHGKAPRKEQFFSFGITPNEEGLEKIDISLSPQGCILSFFRTDLPVEIIRAGWERPLEGQTALEDHEMRPVSSTAELCGSTLKVRCIFYSTPFISDYIFTLEENKLHLKRQRNLCFRYTPLNAFEGMLLPASQGRSFYELY